MRRPPLGDDRGQVSVEFLGLTPLILAVLVLLWQFVLVGYTYTLAAHSADKGARAGTATETGGAGACAAAAKEDLPGAWAGSATVGCGAEGGLWKATVGLKVPVLFPGAGTFPWTVTGTAGAAEEGS
ncbi:septum formation initiator [Streptomyces sp. CB02923]|uniref:TadE/TadG family type IV pilus assembly protein n=1 Tax=Streptomyces sp. CB02923 TaxID=1718985 RepID=UPI0009645FC3|nr:TadE family protein [Streptomyces sp. CB02923]OKI09764.1 septum formation initiator [Streptomyces sp. CB02923]